MDECYVRMVRLVDEAAGAANSARWLLPHDSAVYEEVHKSLVSAEKSLELAHDVLYLELLAQEAKGSK